MRDPDRKGRARDELLRIGAPAFAAAVDLLLADSTDAEMARLVGQIEPDPAAVPSLLELYHRQEEPSLKAAYAALVGFEHLPEAIVDELIGDLEKFSGQNDRLHQTAVLLAKSGSAALPKLDALLLESRDPEARRWAVTALGMMPDEARFTAPIVECLNDDDALVGDAALWALMGKASAIEALIQT
jgi:HEAT repeat protein